MGDETPTNLGMRIAALYKELSYPGVSKFQCALRKGGIRVSDEFVRTLVQEQGTRQLFAPPPRFSGKITARRIDAKWAADLVDFSAKSSKKEPVFITICQEIFSRYLFCRALWKKTEAVAAFSRTLEDEQRTPSELVTDAGSEWTSAEFQRLLQRSKIHHTLKGGPEDISTLDRAIGTLRATLMRRVAHGGGAWFEELDAAVKSINESEHAALFLEEPAEVEHNDDLRFDLRYKNVEMAKQNAQLAKQEATLFGIATGRPRGSVRRPTP